MRRDAVIAVQGLYYLLSGVWPLLHLRSFEGVTGPKVDGWLVKTVGALVAVGGTVMLVSGARGRGRMEAHALAAGWALAFVLIEVAYVRVRRISPIYLADGVFEAFFLGVLLSGRR